MGRILALDYGSKRIGVALSDESNKIAFPKPLIKAETKEKIVELVRTEGVSEILLGLPKNLSGAETGSAETVRKFGAWLASKTGIQMIYVDERFSTKEILREESDRTRVDSLVAQRMLQNYLDNR